MDQLKLLDRGQGSWDRGQGSWEAWRAPLDRGQGSWEALDLRQRAWQRSRQRAYQRSRQRPWSPRQWEGPPWHRAPHGTSLDKGLARHVDSRQRRGGKKKTMAPGVPNKTVFVQ